MAVAGIQVDEATEAATEMEATTASHGDVKCLNLHPSLFVPQECSRTTPKFAVRQESI